jgi:hypothetical protein
MGSDDDVAEAICLVPAGQSVALRQNDSLDPVVRVPEAQGAHRRSDTAEGAPITYEPTGQTVHGVQVRLLLAALKVPAAQGVQLRSTTVEPELATNVPGAQTVQGLHVLPDKNVPSAQVGRQAAPTQASGV